MLPVMKKIDSEEERQAVIQAALADNDRMDFPTHVVLKDGEIAGGWCMAGIPLVMAWNHTQKMKARDSFAIKNIAASIMNDRGARAYFIACNNNSPYMGHMERFGFTPVWATNLFFEQF